MPIYFYFLLTLLIELPLVWWFFRDRGKEALLIGFLLNLFTWPLLHVFIYLTRLPVNVLEAGVAVTEAIGYRIFMGCSWKKAFAVSFLANGISYGIGVLINNYL